jgi:hypothetical protein
MKMNHASIPMKDPTTLQAENQIAAWLSIVPGLGHIYKGQLGAGFFWMFVGMPLAIWVGILMGLATAGIGLVIPILCWAALALDAFHERDVRRHHWLPGPADAEDEDEFHD